LAVAAADLHGIRGDGLHTDVIGDGVAGAGKGFRGGVGIARRPSADGDVIGLIHRGLNVQRQRAGGRQRAMRYGKLLERRIVTERRHRRAVGSRVVDRHQRSHEQGGRGGRGFPNQTERGNQQNGENQFFHNGQLQKSAPVN
jgi:hypothetical protein